MIHSKYLAILGRWDLFSYNASVNKPCYVSQKYQNVKEFDLLVIHLYFVFITRISFLYSTGLNANGYANLFLRKKAAKDSPVFGLTRLHTSHSNTDHIGKYIVYYNSMISKFFGLLWNLQLSLVVTQQPRT